ncbi:hypothetical protein HPB51_019586 [Rhipicephalus microplus]|uniref:Peptidase M13 N-terminal domain-containing protein n=1 Tax=Rhipicephalus microplus TaxID=6941 RepID=A0A9J6E2M0_RHIMP|nr:hypothetical protein HPB51_019586 [Rhipicephalus microplus]
MSQSRKCYVHKVPQCLRRIVEKTGLKVVFMARGSGADMAAGHLRLVLLEVLQIVSTFHVSGAGRLFDHADGAAWDVCPALHFFTEAHFPLDMTALPSLFDCRYADWQPGTSELNVTLHKLPPLHTTLGSGADMAAGHLRLVLLQSVTGSLANRVDAPDLDKTDNAKECVVCTVVLLALVGVLTAVGLYMSFWPRDTGGKTESQDQGSLNVSADMVLKAYMKQDEDPCQNFYQFACGNYESPSRQVLTQMEDDMYVSLAKTLKTAKFPRRKQAATEKAAALYKTCLRVRTGDVDDSAMMTRFMQDVGLTVGTYASANALDKVVMLFFDYNLVSVLDLSLVDTRVHRGHRVLHLGLSTAQLLWLGKRGKVTPGFYTRHLGPFGLNPLSDEAVSVAQSIASAENTLVQELLVRSYPDETAGEFIYRVSELNQVVPCKNSSWDKLIYQYSLHFYNDKDEVLSEHVPVQHFVVVILRHLLSP